MTIDNVEDRYFVADFSLACVILHIVLPAASRSLEVVDVAELLSLQVDVAVGRGTYYSHYNISKTAVKVVSYGNLG